MSDEVVLYETYDLKDRVLRSCEWTNNGQTKHRTKQQELAEVLSEEVMAQLDELIGNALGKVTVGGELSHSKEYGCSAKSFVSMSITCDNSLETCQAVHDIVQPTVRALINEDLNMMKEDRDRHLSGEQVAPAPEGRVSSGPPQPKKIVPRTSTPNPMAAAPAVNAVKKLPPKPSFRR
jgi:hypothetical protein